MNEREAMDALRTSNHALQAALDVANMATWGWDETAAVELWSAKTKAIFGVAPAIDMTKELFVSLLHPEDVPRYQAAWAAAIDPLGNHVYQLVYRIHRANDGAERWISSKAAMEFDGEQLVRVMGALRDITDEQVAAKDLRQSEAKLKLGMAVAGLGLGAMDYFNDQITLDETAASLFALPSNSRVPRGDVHARFHPDDAPSIEALVAAALDPTGSGFMSVDHRIVRPDGSVRWVAARKQVEFSPYSTGCTRRATTGKKHYARSKELAAQGLVSQDQVSDALANLAIAQNQLANVQFQAKVTRAKGSEYAIAETELRKARIYEQRVKNSFKKQEVCSEFSGVLTSCNVVHGDVLFPGKTLMLLSP